MTRSFDKKVHCPECGEWHTAETAFGRWMRNNGLLDSKSGIVCFDCDILLHMYAQLHGKQKNRDVQCLMFVEVKSREARPSAAQRDTLSLFAQVLRNRKDNLHRRKRGRHLIGHVTPTKAYSQIKAAEVKLRMYGGHLLRLSGDSPEDSQWMEWDERRLIDQTTLIGLLRFEIDPDTLHPLDLRIHHANRQMYFIDKV
jgi:hypothetical protein